MQPRPDESNPTDIDLTVLRDFYKGKILELLTKCTGSKSLVLDEKSVKMLDFFISMNHLQNVNVIHTYKLEAQSYPTCDDVNHVVFILVPIPAYIQMVANFIDSIKRNKKTEKLFSLFLIPNIDLFCLKKLDEFDIRKSLYLIEAIPIYLYPFDNDLVSLEYPNAFKECYIDEDFSIFKHCADAIITIQSIFGEIPRIKGKGDHAKKIIQLLAQKRHPNENTIISPQIDTLILVDRSVDLVTPFITELTYEGLIRSTFDTNMNTLTLSHSFLDNKNRKDSSFSKISLNSSNKFYSSLRYMFFPDLTRFISQSAQKLSSNYTSVKGLDIPELKELVTKIPDLNHTMLFIQQHTYIAENISLRYNKNIFHQMLEAEKDMYCESMVDKSHPIIDQLIGYQQPIYDLIRLMGLQSIIRGGLKTRVYTDYCETLTQAYGYNAVNLLLALEKANIMRCEQDNSRLPRYSNIIKQLKLVNQDSTQQRRTSQFYNSYSPLSIKIIQFMIEDFVIDMPSKTMSDILKSLPGETIKSCEGISKLITPKNVKVDMGQNIKRVLIFFIGGCTSSEIAALRHLNQTEGSIYDYLIATTSILNSTSLVSTLIQDIKLLSCS